MAQEVIEVVEREVEVIEILERGLMGMTGPQANINYLVVSSSQTVTNRQMIAANTLAGSFTLTLPSNPAAGDAIDIFDYSDTFDTNPLTIARNGQNIEGLADDLVANVEGAYFTLIFTGGSRGWQVVPRYGVSGLQNVLTTEGDLLYRGGSAETRLGIGTAGQILKVNSGATAPEWGNEVMSAADKTKLDGIAAGAEVNVNADWNAVSGDAQILNKPATFTPSSHTHGNITNDGKIGATSGLPVVTTTDGAVTTLALGAANQVLRVNSGATGVEFGAGFDAASPPAIGSTTPAAATFTNLSANTRVNLPNTNGTTAGDLYRNANTLRYRDSTNTERLLLNATDNLSNLANTATARANIGLGSANNVTFGSIQNTPIGSTTAAAITGTTGTFSTLSANNGTIAASAPALTVQQTWNDSAANFVGASIEITNTNNTNNSSSAFRVRVGGTDAIRVDRFRDVIFGANMQMGGASSAQVGTIRFSGFVNMVSPSIGVIDMREGASPCDFRIHGQYTSTTNFERLSLKYNSTATAFQIGTEKGTSGSARPLEFQTDGVTRMTIGTTGNVSVGTSSATYRLNVSASANASYVGLLENTGSGASWRGGLLMLFPNVTSGGSGALFFGGKSLSSYNGFGINYNHVNDGSTSNYIGFNFFSADNLLNIIANGLVSIGGTTNAFPALKRSSTTLQVRLADDTAFAPFAAAEITATGNLVLTDNDGAQTATFDAQSKLTANRTYDLPNASGTIALTNGSTNLWIAASQFIPRTTNGCGVDSRETSTNRTNWDELLFDAGADEFAQAVVVMPSNYNNGTVTARFYWTASTAGDGTDDVIWGIQARAFADDAALDAAFGSAVTVTDTLLATNDMHVTSATSAATIDGTPAANRPILFQIYRDADAAGDTYSADARLLGVEIIYTAA